MSTMSTPKILTPTDVSEVDSRQQNVDDILTSLCSHAKLDRDRGADQLRRYLNSASRLELIDLFTRFKDLAQDTSAKWETNHGALLGLRELAKPLFAGLDSSEERLFMDQTIDTALALLMHKEVRVRLSAGELMGRLCSVLGPTVYNCCRESVLEMIQSNLLRSLSRSDSEVSFGSGLASRTASFDYGERNILDDPESLQKLVNKLKPENTSHRGSVDAAQIFHDTAGWRNLETSMKALQFMIEACGPKFQDRGNPRLMQLIFDALQNKNRFVRETALHVCASLITCSAVDDEWESSDGESENDKHLTTVAEQYAYHLAAGLTDNWSQVRLAAAVATRKFLMCLQDRDTLEKYFPLLLPRLCLNRYYMAEGVRLYSQESWRLIVGLEGKALVAKYIDDVVKYYLAATKADNHAVREAACACIAELGAKIPADVVKPYIGDMLDTLIECFQDESWPVRDAACLACGNFIASFPEGSRGSLEKLMPLFFENLEDNIPSVRQGAAASLAKVMQAYGDEVVPKIAERIRESLRGIEKQPQDSVRLKAFERGPAQFGVAKQIMDEDSGLHSNQPMFSCGSLAPKMGRRDSKDHKFRRPTQPWETADGCVYLLAELAGVPGMTEQVTELLPFVVDAMKKKDYTHHFFFIESVCKCIPALARNMGKKAFKEHLESFFDDIFYALNSDNALASTAASVCLQELSQFIGPNILRGRIENHNPAYLRALEQSTLRRPV